MDLPDDQPPDDAAAGDQVVIPPNPYIAFQCTLNVNIPWDMPQEDFSNYLNVYLHKGI